MFCAIAMLIRSCSIARENETHAGGPRNLSTESNQGLDEHSGLDGPAKIQQCENAITSSRMEIKVTCAGSQRCEHPSKAAARHTKIVRSVSTVQHIKGIATLLTLCLMYMSPGISC